MKYHKHPKGQGLESFLIAEFGDISGGSVLGEGMETVCPFPCTSLYVSFNLYP
jgi:hypothetical protein